MLRSPVVRLLWCALGAAIGLCVALWLVAPPRSPFLLASLGGSAVFLFGFTRTPAAQPRALFGGHLGGAVIGIACYQFFGDGLWVYCLAQALALAYMLLTKTVHPPAGANPPIMIYGHCALSALWQPVFVGVLGMALVAMLWSRLFPGLARYPVSWFERSPSSISLDGWSASGPERIEQEPAPNRLPMRRLIPCGRGKLPARRDAPL